MQYCFIKTPIGKILIAGNDGKITLLNFQDGTTKITPPSDWLYKETAFKNPTTQINDYFAGKLKSFNIPFLLSGSPFQIKVLKTLQEIPYGETATYGEIAKQVGSPKGARAIGLANSRNPLPIIIPCHRVIGANGQLTGFTGGLDIKQKLLEHEKQNCTEYV